MDNPEIPPLLLTGLTADLAVIQLVYCINYCLKSISLVSITRITSVRVQPLPSYFGYIMHNNILMMLDLVAVTEY